MKTGAPRVVVALGGNAAYPPTIQGTAQEQLAIMRDVCHHFVRIIAAGYTLILTHGNGPVVGNILYRMARTASEVPPMPMDVCVSHSQGGLGYMLQQSLANALHEAGIARTVSAIVTEVEVDPADPAFSKPTKPVGKFFSKEQADAMAASTGWTFMEDAGRGWRRIVPSPKPKQILDLPTVEALIEAGVVPITCGGGGIPVVIDGDGLLHGVAAVIDKDLTSAKLAAHLQAQTLLLLTGVDRVALDFGKASERWLDRMTLKEARIFRDDGQFPPGSMGPKIDAAIDYLEHFPQGRVVITSLERALDGVKGLAGTEIVTQ